MFAADWSVGDVVLSMLWFTLFFLWIWLVIVVFSDIFRSPDLSGWSKAIWSIFIIFLPYLGVFIYLIARGHKMQEHAIAAAKQQDQAMREYVQSVSGTSASTADELHKLSELKEKGVITDAEFEAQKAKLLG